MHINEAKSLVTQIWSEEKNIKTAINANLAESMAQLLVREIQSTLDNYPHAEDILTVTSINPQ